MSEPKPENFFKQMVIVLIAVILMIAFLPYSNSKVKYNVECDKPSIVEVNNQNNKHATIRQIN